MAAFARGGWRAAGAPNYLGANCVPPHMIHEVLDVILRCAAVDTGDADDEPARGLTGCVLYPNGGGTWDPRERRWSGCGRGFADALAAEWALRLRAARLEAIIGGCCNTDVATVEALDRVLVSGRHEQLFE